MKYYTELLDNVFSALSGKEQPRILALTFSIDENAASPEQGIQARFEFPTSSLPPDADLQFLPHDESFIEKAVSIASTAQCVFVLPPSLGEKRFSDAWREQYGYLGMTEVLASRLMGEEKPLKDGLSSPTQPHLQFLVMLVPTSFVATMRTSEWRNQFFPEHRAVVIEHEHTDVPAALGLPLHSAVRFCTIILQREPGPIRFFKITDAALAEGPHCLASDLRRLLKQPAGKSRFGYVYAGPLEADYSCSYDFYSEETRQLRAEIGQLGARVFLSSVADVLVGFRPIFPGHDASVGETGFHFVTAPAITKNGRIDLSELQTQTRPVRMVQYLQDGDFCIRRIYRAESGFVVGIYEGDGRPVSFNSTIIVVRPHARLNPAQRQVLFTFLRSPLSHRLSNAKQLFSSLNDCFRVDIDVLKNFPVPLADDELVSAIQQLTEARNAFSKWIDQIESESNPIVMEATALGSRRRILRAGQLARQRYRAAQQVEELDYRIRTQFPHPLAHAWRELQVTGNDRYQRFRGVTKAAEEHTCFLALVAILISLQLREPIAYVTEVGKRLSQRKGGTNFGDWLAIIKEINQGHAFRQHQTTAPFSEVMQLCASDVWEPAIKKLKGLRDDDSHGRISPTSVSADVLADAEKALETVYRATEFLSDYRLIFLANTRFDSIRQINRYDYRDLTGDNALSPLRQDHSSRSDLERGSLYLRDRKGNLHLFRPLLHYLECPECHLMSTFFLDTYNPTRKGDIVGLKSFERNSVRYEPVADDFRHIGLLLPEPAV